MKCPSCQYENPDDSMFCGECGSSLEVNCPNCGAKPPLNFKFCNKCGQNLIEFSQTEIRSGILDSNPIIPYIDFDKIHQK
jgi:ribosomal protein L40E